MTCRIGGFIQLAFAALVLVLAGGCETGSPGSYSGGGAAARGGTNDVISIDRIYVGDQIRIVYADAPVPIAPTEIQVPETGLVAIHMGEQIKVAGKKTDEVAQEIKTLFTVTKQMYKRLAVTVQIFGRSVSVGGEVRTPGAFPFEGGVTVLKAVNKAGGFTEFANRSEVRVTRVNGDQFTVDCKKAQRKPELDLPLYPGDRVHVVRGIL